MPNRLILEQSPYLLQHANNPVDWYPWCDEAFELAKKEHKPVLVSIGYAACHWCHVMERESFEHEEVASFMNAHFVNIKVDREEHPDVDHMYMDAVQAISGSGGWPLNVFVTPDRIPFYGGTYYPPVAAYSRPSWMQLLHRMKEIWETRQDDVQMQTEQMLQYLQQAAKAAVSVSKQWDMNDCSSMAQTLLQQADKIYGGFGNAPKFPGSMAISFLLEHAHYTGNDNARAHALLSLDKMIEGGIYDQLGGGFARYSTDERWLAPHFEKMLYDNALLIHTLCDANRITGNRRYESVIRDTAAFIESELKDASGGYYSALDADSEGVEGKFYTWTWEEWQEAVGNDEIAAMYYGIEEAGNWEHTNILHVSKHIDTISEQTGKGIQNIATHIQSVKEKLFTIRTKRIRPLTDDKSLLSWNALMNMALTRAAIALQDDVFLQRAAAHMEWMLEAFVEEELYHVWKGGKAKIAAKLDDIAYLIQALLQLGSASGNNTLIVKAMSLTQTVIENFSDEAGIFFYFTSVHQHDVPVRKIDLYDGAMPSPNAVMAHNLQLLGLCMERPDLLERAYHMLNRMAANAMRYTYSFGYWAMLLQRYAIGEKIIIASGVDADSVARGLRTLFVPHAYILAVKSESAVLPVFEHKFSTAETRIFVCTHEACIANETDVSKIIPFISH